MEVSICIAYHNDPFIHDTIKSYLNTSSGAEIEILVYDDASEPPLVLSYPNTKVINAKVHKGVGFAFDSLVDKASFETIILSGSDIMSKDGWYDKVVDYINSYPSSIGCSVCLTGDPLHTDPNYPVNDNKRYGATIEPFATQETLRTDNQLTFTEPYYVGMWNARWIKQEPEDEVSEIPCVYGAQYFTTKSWYKHIRGWDYSHRSWGVLEPWLCIKNHLMGGRCHVIKSIESLHIFDKFTQDWTKGHRPATKWEDIWHNQVFVAYTMLPTQDFHRLVKKVYDTRIKYELHTRLFNLGYSLVKKNEENVNKIKARNTREFVHDFDWFLNKFNIEKNY
jgi:hypothetical protein